MELKNVLSIHRIDLNAQASTKKRALELVTECCASMMERPDFFHSLIEREKLGSTGLGHGVALPHARIAHLHSPMACFFKLENPVDYEAPDQASVDLIIGLFVPEEAREGHLQLLSQIAQLMSQDTVRAALRQCQHVHEALRILTEPFGEQALVS
jgi:PTS system nitrogen regulatory IIA component